MEDGFAAAREMMVMGQLVPRGIKSAAALDAMRSVPRHLFVPESLRRSAYGDFPLPIANGQTISQPYIVAYMTELLSPARGMKVLEIGTGSGYQAAVLAHLGCEVYSVELIEALADEAEKLFIRLGYPNIKVKRADGFRGWQEEAPFDAVIVTAAPEEIPAALFDQLKEGGRMAVPVGKINSVQSLKLIEKIDGQMLERDLLPVRFVPMTGGE